ncbi:MAG: hypothetical protein QXH03_10945 [Candidatus Bathyarchaeia archaeon]
MQNQVKAYIWCPHINETIRVTISAETIIGKLVTGIVTGCEKQNECNSKGWCWINKRIQTATP